MVDSPFAQRAKQQRRQKIKQYFIAAAVLMVIGGVVWFVAFSPIMNITTIKVIGNSIVSSEAVQKAARVDQATTLARVNTAEVSENVAKIAQVATVDVKRSWPRTLTITITERRAIGFYVEGNRYRLLDSEGVTFDKSKKKPKELVEIRFQGKAGSTDEAKRGAASVVDFWANNAPDLYQDIRYVFVDGPDAITVVLKGGTKVVWGSAERMDDKLSVLSVLRKIPARVYDISAPNQPTTRK